MAKVIFNRPVKLGKVIHQKSKLPQEVADEHLKDKLMVAFLASGEVAVVPAAPPAPEKAASAKSAK